MRVGFGGPGTQLLLQRYLQNLILSLFVMDTLGFSAKR